MGDALAVWVDDTAARYPLTIDPLVQQAKLVASDGAAGDFFGLSVALSADGNTALVGADGKNGFQGAAYVFVRSGTTWSQQQKLTAADGAAGDQFGGSVALSGDGNTALVGADGKNGFQGAAYVFVRSGTTWSQQQKLTAADGAAGDQFGGSVALSGDGNTALVGADGKNGFQGAAYVFVRSGTTWSQQQKLTAADGAAGDQFGGSVALSGDGNTALVGADGKNGFQGAAYVFVRSGTTWSQQQKLTASDGAAGDQFGGSVALSGDDNTALVGAAGATIGSNADQGAAYVFVRSGTTWSQQQKLTASDGAVDDFFGLSVALSGDGNTALVGADGKNGFQGAAYVFVRSGTTWSQQQKLTAADGAVFDNFSLSVALSGDGNTALVGAYGKNGQQGAAYVFVRSGTTWSQQQKLTASDGAAGDQFGGSVALSGDDNTALVGAVAAKIGSNIQQGAAYVFAQPPIPTPTSTATATPTATPSATATSTPTPTATATPTCATVGAVCHATLAPGGPNGLFASGPLAPGPCAPPAASNCLQTTSTGSFTVQGTLAGLPSGAQAALSLPVVNAQGALLGARAVLCPPAGPTGSMACSGAVAEPGVFPQLGGLVGLRLLAAVALAAPVPLLPPPVAPLPPPVVLPPLPAPLVPPPPPPAAPAPAFPKVPVIPEAESLALLLGGLLGFLGLRRLRRR